jgi:hypothetical protein
MSDLLVNNGRQRVTTGLRTKKMLAMSGTGNNSDKGINNFWTLQSSCKAQTTCHGNKSKWDMLATNKQEMRL